MSLGLLTGGEEGKQIMWKFWGEVEVFVKRLGEHILSVCAGRL